MLMKITSLFAPRQIRKSYKLAESGAVTQSNYPNVYEVTSETAEICSISELFSLANEVSKRGGTLLKGNIARNLLGESRAGSTRSDEETQWICLDLDGITGYASVDLFLKEIGCSGVSYVLQWSSSMGIKGKDGLRCHIFMLLRETTTPEVLKRWLTSKNLSTPALRSQLKLTKTTNHILWPLDITTCQNDKLLYVATPLFGKGVRNPLPGKKRILEVKKKSPHLSIDTSQVGLLTALRADTEKRIKELRKEAGLPAKRITKYKFEGTQEYAANPDTAQITGIKEERGFVYLNINNGNSWGYFHSSNNPEFISNFKGEPTYKTSELLPEYWAKLKEDSPTTANTLTGENIHLAFREFSSGNYYNGTYTPATNTLNIAIAKNKAQLKDFLGNHGITLGDTVPDWDIEWDPNNEITVDEDNQTLNRFIPGEYLRSPKSKKVQKTMPLVIQKVIYSALGDDPDTVDHFLNWLAYIVQRRTRTGTAWVLHGTQGTGKGVLYNNILTPVLGMDNTVSKRMEELESEFTGFMENKLLVFVDEIDSGNSLYRHRIDSKLKNMIVEPMISVRQMYSPARMVQNHANMIFASNKPGSVDVAPDDRRFNVGGYQNTPLKLTAKEVNEDIPNELLMFYNYLAHRKVGEVRAITPLRNEAKERLVTISRTAIDTFTDALNQGNMQFFMDMEPDDPTQLSPLDAIKFDPYKRLLTSIREAKPNLITRDEIGVLLNWCMDKTPTSPHKLTTYLRHHNIHLKQVWAHGKNTRGMDLNWVVPAKLKEVKKGR